MELVLIVLFSIFAQSFGEKIEHTKISELIEKLSDIEHKGFQEKIETSLWKSVDTKCASDTYERFNLSNFFPSHEVFDDSSNEASMKIFVFTDIAILCCRKVEKLLDLAFESLMTTKALFDIFIDDPELQDYKDMLTCANNYAITNEIIDGEKYKLNYTLDEKAKENCNNLVSLVKDQMSRSEITASIRHSDSCSSQVLKNIEHFFVKKIHLIQIDFNSEQREIEKQSLKFDFKNTLESVLECAKETNMKLW
jgi:hypothetical protein